MKQQCYTQVDSVQQPINIRACSTIKCMYCDQQYPPYLLQAHFNAHIKQKYKNHINLPPKMQKVSLKNMLFDDEASQINIKSMAEADLPKIQKKRKQVIKLNNCIQKTGSQFDFSEITLQSQPKKDIYSKMQYEQEFIEEEGVIEFQKKINLSQQNTVVKQKKISYYKNANQSASNRDKGGNKTKHCHAPNQQNEHKVYEVQKILTQKNPLKQQKPKVCEINITPKKKNPKKFYNVSTAYKTNQQDGEVISEFDETEEKDYKRFECRQCKGFYCQTCKSSIPPIYRPVPDNQGKYDFGRIEEVMKFGNDRSCKKYQN